MFSVCEEALLQAVTGGPRLFPYSVSTIQRAHPRKRKGNEGSFLGSFCGLDMEVEYIASSQNSLTRTEPAYSKGVQETVE